MKSLLTLGVMALVLLTACAKRAERSATSSGRNVEPVSESVAKSMAEVFNPTAYYNLNNATDHYPIKNTLNGSNAVQNVVALKDKTGQTAIYVCNFANEQGFLILSADYQVKPVLGFAHQGNFDLATWNRMDKSIPPGFVHWLNNMLSNVSAVREGAMGTSTYGQIFWKDYVEKNMESRTSYNDQRRAVQTAIMEEFSTDTKPPPPPPNPCTSNPGYMHDSGFSAGPLVSYTWGQAQTYNESCPNDACTEAYGPNALVGCVPTALAMVMAYWKPKTYDQFYFAGMPATYGDTAVERMMASLGQNTATSYGCLGTGTDPINAGQGFSNVIRIGGWKNGILATYSTSNSVLIDSIVLDLNNGVPVFLSANDPNAGPHFWVVDGYSQVWATYCSLGEPQTDYSFTYHMNWGFHETRCNPPLNLPDYNGWYDYSNWPTSGGGPGGAGLNFNQDEQVLYGVHPS